MESGSDKILKPKIQNFPHPIYAYLGGSCHGTFPTSYPLFNSKTLRDWERLIQLNTVLKRAHAHYVHAGAAGLPPLRVVFTQLSLMDTEERDIRTMHNMVIRLNKERDHQMSYCHFLLPTEPLYFTDLSKRLIGVAPSDLRSITQEMSLEALMTYSCWLSMDIEKTYQTLVYSNTEEYELAKRLKDFSHEAQSKIVLAIKKDIEDCVFRITELESQGGGDLQVLELERQLVHYREELRKQLEYQIVSLDLLQAAIEKISRTHSELDNLYFTVVLLKNVMKEWVYAENSPFEQWGRKLLLQHLLDEQLNVMPIVMSRSGYGRASIAFAIRYAMRALGQSVSRKEIVTMALDWRGDNSKEVTAHVEELRKLAYETLQVFPCHDKTIKPENAIINKEIVAFFPPGQESFERLYRS